MVQWLGIYDGQNETVGKLYKDTIQRLKTVQRFNEIKSMVGNDLTKIKYVIKFEKI